MPSIKMDKYLEKKKPVKNTCNGMTSIIGQAHGNPKKS